jgi:predicted NBD/HSP70 family sugar kinase
VNCDSLIQKRTRNKSIILRHIKENEDAIVQSDLCRMTGLSKMTMASIIKELKKEKLIRETGYGKASTVGGRRPKLIKINKRGVIFIGVALDWDSTLIAALDFNYETIKEYVCEINFALPPDQAIEEIARNIKELLVELDVSREIISGICIGVPGAVSSKEGVCIYSAKFNWVNVPLVGLLAEKCQMPVFIETDVRLRALAENYYNFNEQAQSMFYVNVGTGLGSALIIDGKIYCGSSHMAGEIGHVVVDKNGPECACGNIGCLQMFMSSQGIIAQYDRLPEAKRNFAFDRKNPEESLFDAVKQDNESAKSILATGVSHLSSQLQGVINLTDPEYIVLGGKVIEADRDKLILTALKEDLSSKIFNAVHRKVNILESQLKRKAVLIGASSMLYRTLF